MSTPQVIDAEILSRLLKDGMVKSYPTFQLPKPPKFRRMREVHARRAAKLRHRGEYVHFLRWEHGHCIYGWGGPVPDTFYIRMPPESEEGSQK